MSDAQANFAYSIVAVAPSPAISGTSLTVTAGDGALFPAVPFNCTVWPINQIPLATNAEIVRVTNIAGDVFTITRAQEGSTAQAIAIGYQIANTATVKTFTDLVPKTTTLSAGTGLSGGGDLSANRSFAVAGNLATLFGLSNASGWLHNDGSGVLVWSTPTVPSGANPTATIGLAAVNGTAATFMRSDAAPALSQSIAPTWTGVHVFNAGKLTIQDTTTTGNTLVLASNSSIALTANRTLTIDVSNANRTLKLTGNPTLSDWFDQPVKTTSDPSFASITAGATGGYFLGGNLFSLFIGNETRLYGGTSGLAVFDNTGTYRNLHITDAGDAHLRYQRKLSWDNNSGDFDVLCFFPRDANSVQFPMELVAQDGGFYGANSTSTGNRAYCSDISGDSYNRFQLFHNGEMHWGPGNADLDTYFYRNGSGTLETPGNFNFGGKLTVYKNITTAGWGSPAIYGSGRATAQTTSVASVAAYTVGGADGSFEVSANVNLTTAGVGTSFTVTCTYTDETNAARTLTLGFTQLSGATFLTAITTATGTGPYESPVYHIRCKASTSITIATTGTFPVSPSSCVYNVEGIIKQTA